MPNVNKIIDTINRRLGTIYSETKDINRGAVSIFLSTKGVLQVSIYFSFDDHDSCWTRYYYNYGDDRAHFPKYETYGLSIFTKNVVMGVVGRVGNLPYIRNLKYYIPPTCKESWIFGIINMAYGWFPKKNIKIYIRKKIFVVYGRDSQDKKYELKFAAMPNRLINFVYMDAINMDFSKPFIFGDRHNNNSSNTKRIELKHSEVLMIDKLPSIDILIHLIRDKVLDMYPKATFRGNEDVCIVCKIEQI